MASINADPHTLPANKRWRSARAGKQLPLLCESHAAQDDPDISAHEDWPAFPRTCLPTVTEGT